MKNQWWHGGKQDFENKYIYHSVVNCPQFFFFLIFKFMGFVGT